MIERADEYVCVIERVDEYVCVSERVDEYVCVSGVCVRELASVCLSMNVNITSFIPVHLSLSSIVL